MIRRTVTLIRATLALVLASVSLVAWAAWAANTPFPLAVLQTVGIADTGELHGVTWGVDLPYGDALDGLSITVQEQDVHIRWYRMHEDNRGGGTRYFWGPPWPAGVRTGTLRKPYVVARPNGTSIAYRSYSQLFLEAPLWGVSLIAAPYPIVVLWRGPLRLRRRRKLGLCLQCGYNLTGNTTGVCPECSQKIEGKCSD